VSTTKIKGTVILEHPDVKASLGHKKCPVIVDPQNSGFGGI